MKLLSALLFIGIFVALPLYTLSSLVLPSLDSMQQQYQQTAVTAENLASQQ